MSLEEKKNFVLFTVRQALSEREQNLTHHSWEEQGEEIVLSISVEGKEKTIQLSFLRWDLESYGETTRAREQIEREIFGQLYSKL